MALAKFTGMISVPLIMATLGFSAFSSLRGGIRWILMAPGPSGLSVVCKTSLKQESMYSLILLTVLVFLNSLGTGIIINLL